jgi:hypothetical protein
MKQLLVAVLIAVFSFYTSACSSVEVKDEGDGFVSVVYEDPNLILGVIPTLTKREVTFNFFCNPKCVQIKEVEEK